MLVTEPEILTLVKLLQLLKADFSMFVTELGIWIFVKLLQS